MRILDYGCGDGRYKEIQEDNRLVRDIWLLRHHAPETWGVDISMQNIANIQQLVDNGTQFRVADGGALPFEDGYFDLLHDGFVLHHMDDYRQGIKEIGRVVRTGGLLIATESVDNDLFFRACRRIAGKWRGDRISSFFRTEELHSELSQYFDIFYERFYWRCALSDIMALWGRESRSSLRFCDWVSHKLGNQAQRFCCHYVIKGVRI